MGGQTGIAIYPTEWNKKQILDKIIVSDYQSIFFLVIDINQTEMITP